MYFFESFSRVEDRDDLPPASAKPHTGPKGDSPQKGGAASRSHLAEVQRGGDLFVAREWPLGRMFLSSHIGGFHRTSTGSSSKEMPTSVDKPSLLVSTPVYRNHLSESQELSRVSNLAPDAVPS